MKLKLKCALNENWVFQLVSLEFNPPQKVNRYFFGLAEPRLKEIWDSLESKGAEISHEMI